MFETIKKQVNLLEVLQEDLSVTFRQAGEKNWIIDGDKESEACPFCTHHDCFRVHYVEGDNTSAFYKCFSCGEQGDVVTWTSKRKGITLGDAIKDLAAKYNVQLPRETSPTQQIFTVAAEYYHACLMETCNKPNPTLNGLTPLRYQLEVRHRKLESLNQFKIGFSDGGLVSFLEGVGFDRELIEKSGLVSLKTGRDFLPTNCFIYPHFVKGKASHFTFKDPNKQIQYQLPKKYSLNGYLFYGQDSVRNFSSFALVEGENDWLAMVEAGGVATLATIGQLSSEQLEWLKTNCFDKKVVTLFDPDDAGDKYREKIELIRGAFPAVVHVKPPHGKDIDELLTTGHSMTDIVRNNQVKVEIKLPEKKQLPVLPWEDEVKTLERPKPVNDVPSSAPALEGISEVAPEPKLSKGMSLVGPAGYVPPEIPQDEVSTNPRQEITEDTVYQIAEGNLLLMRNCYYKVVVKDDKTNYVRLSNFYLELKNIYLHIGETKNDRRRELIVHRCDGYKSQPFEVDSETKVSVGKFKTLIATVADAEWFGREQDLDNMWRLIYDQYPEVLIEVVKQVGRNEKYKCWIFKNILVTDSGRQILPDENGVFWTQGRSKGIKLKGITDNDELDGLPSLNLEVSRQQADETLIETVHGLAKIFKGYGQPLMCMGWIQANLYSNDIYKKDKGFGSLMIWGMHGAGKSTITGWMQSFFGMSGEMGKSSVQQLRGGVAFLRKAAHYSSIPLLMDEVRCNEEMRQYMGMVRSWYDRQGRNISKDIADVRVVPIKANLMLAGEDLPDDGATRERCIMLRLDSSDNSSEASREKNSDTKNFQRLNYLSDNFSGILYHWLIDSTKTDRQKVMEGISELDQKLVEAGCSNRTSKVWASAAYFASKLGTVICPEFDFLTWAIQACQEEQKEQKEESVLNRFFTQLATIRSFPNSKFTDDHYAVSGNLLYIWFPPTFTAVMDSTPGSYKNGWSKKSILSALQNEPYYISKNKKVGLGLDNHRVTVITLDLDKCPEVLREMCEYGDTHGPEVTEVIEKAKQSVAHI